MDAFINQPFHGSTTIRGISSLTLVMSVTTCAIVFAAFTGLLIALLVSKQIK
jgi:hypothetical protein